MIYIYIYCIVVKLQLVMWCLSFLLDPHCNIYICIYMYNMQNDTIIYSTMVPQNIKDLISRLPPVNLGHNAKTLGLLKPYMMVLLTAVVTVIAWRVSCL